MKGSAEQAMGNIFPSKNLNHTGDGLRRLTVDASDSCVGMRRAQDLQVQQVVHCHIHRVTGFSRDNRRTERICQASPTSLPGDILFNVLCAVKSIDDTAVTGAPAKV